MRDRTVLVGTAPFVALMLAVSAVSTWLAVEARRLVGEALTAKSQSDDNAHLANERKVQVEILAKGFQQALYDADLELMPAAWEADDLAAFDELARTAGQRQTGGRPARF